MSKITLTLSECCGRWKDTTEKEIARSVRLRVKTRWVRHAQSHSRVWLSATPRAAARQPPLSMGFSRQEYWSGLLFPPPGDLPNPRIKPMSLASPSLAGGFFTPEPPGKPHITQYNYKNQDCNIDTPVPSYFQIHCSITCCHNNIIYSKINQSEITSCI